MTESKNPRLSEHAVVTEEHRKWAQQVWDEIADDDECCIGNPEGSEFIEENIIPKLAQLLADRDVAQAAKTRLSEEQVKKIYVAMANRFSQRQPHEGAWDEPCRIALEVLNALLEATPAPKPSEGFVVTDDALRTALDEFRANLIAMTMLEAPPAPASQPVSAPAEKKEWITADDFLEHAYVTNDSSDGISTVECKCGITFLSQNEDSGRARKRHSDHRLIALNARLAPRIEAHIAAALGNSTCHQAMCRDELLWRASIELAEVRAALKEAQWWASGEHGSSSAGNDCEDSDCRECRRFAKLRAREAELLARGGAKP